MTQSENYVLSAVIINERDYQRIDNGLRQIKIKYFPNLSAEDIEIHAKDMLNRDGVFQNLNWDIIYAIFTDVFDFISDVATKLTIISVVMIKYRIWNKSLDLESWGHKLLFERFNLFTKEKNRYNTENFQPNEFCIMITDTEGLVKDQHLRKKLIPILKNGTNSNLIEDPLFTDSKWRNLSQLSDNIAYCVRKRFRINKPSFHTTNWERYFKKIEIKFDANPQTGDYIGYGLKIFPKKTRGERSPLSPCVATWLRSYEYTPL